MVILLVLLLASPDLRCAPSSEIHLSSSPPDPWSPQRDLCFSAQRSEQPDVGDRRNHVHKSQRPRRPSRSARQGNRKERKKQTDGSDAPEDADRAPGEPTDDGEYGSRANSTGHTGAHDLAKRYNPVRWDDDRTQVRRRDREHKRIGAGRPDRSQHADSQQTPRGNPP